MAQQDIKMRSCSQKLPWGASRKHTIVNHKVCQILKPDFNFGIDSRNSKSNPRRVSRETRATELSVAFEVSSDRCAERDFSIHLLTCTSLKISRPLSEIRGLNTVDFLRRLLQGLLSKCGKPGWRSGHQLRFPPLLQNVVCGLSFSRSQPDFEGFLRALLFPPSSKIDSQSNPSGCGAVLLRGHVWIVFRGRAPNRQHGSFSPTSLSCAL